ncbi:MAG TPA: AzlD domain-containing protein [Candidatus Limnocylindria bacterium]
MSTTWLVVLAVGAATVLIKGAGPVLLGGRALPGRLTTLLRLLAPAVLAALVATQVVVSGSRLVVDERLLALAVAFVALLLRAPVLVVVILAALVTALARLVTSG